MLFAQLERAMINRGGRGGALRQRQTGLEMSLSSLDV